jgi:hypothetical protein
MPDSAPSTPISPRKRDKFQRDQPPKECWAAPRRTYSSGYQNSLDAQQKLKQEQTDRGDDDRYFYEADGNVRMLTMEPGTGTPDPFPWQKHHSKAGSSSKFIDGSSNGGLEAWNQDYANSSLSERTASTSTKEKA